METNQKIVTYRNYQCSLYLGGPYKPGITVIWKNQNKTGRLTHVGHAALRDGFLWVQDAVDGFGGQCFDLAVW